MGEKQRKRDGGYIDMRDARAAVVEVSRRLGGTAALAQWARANPDEFWKLYGRLIPRDVSVSGTIGVAALLAEVARADAAGVPIPGQPAPAALPAPDESAVPVHIITRERFGGADGRARSLAKRREQGKAIRAAREQSARAQERSRDGGPADDAGDWPAPDAADLVSGCTSGAGARAPMGSGEQVMGKDGEMGVGAGGTPGAGGALTPKEPPENSPPKKVF